ncbi:hypothetical protein [Candidatus Avelusimicrobium sp.]|uniref:hypothetical protein n=1 Tax=Candidatus Avelusimicrobium sp. TaxID=3048833 RepID=UPI003D7D304F
MKKTSSKIILLLVCVAVIVFLLLPFLETTAPAPANAQASAAAQKATPQIFTSNPLTALLQRMARLLRRTNARQKAQTAQKSGDNKAAQPEQIADARAALKKAPANQETADGVATSGRYNYGDASMQTEDGDWVLIRQTAPEGMEPGMHEINTQENAYDRYIRQERAARFTPAADSTSKETQVPDSKLARLFSPITKFFGFNDAKQTSANPDIWQDESEAALLASSDKIARGNGGKYAPGFARAQMADFEGPASGAGASGAAPQPTQNDMIRAISFLMPDEALAKLADDTADALYPNPKTPDEKEQKAQFIKDFYAKHKDEIIAQVNDLIAADAAGKQPVDQVANIIGNGSCNDNSPAPASIQTTCDPDASPQKTAQQVANARAQNAQNFYQETGFALPPLPVTFVAGQVNAEADSYPATPSDNQQDQSLQEQTKEIYAFMVKNNQCGEGNCFWVANSVQNTQDLTNIVQAANLTFKGDPLGKYNQIKQQFIEAKIQEMGANADPREIKALQQQVQRAAPPYIVYSDKDLVQVQEKNRQASSEAVNKGLPPKDLSVMYITSAADGQAVSQVLGSSDLPPYFGYNASGDILEKGTVAQSSSELTGDLIRAVKFGKGVLQQMSKETSQEILEPAVSAAAQEMREAAEKQKKDFNQKSAARASQTRSGRK